MKNFSGRLFVIFSLLSILSIAAASVSEARIGGGRSSGFRGSRGFGTRPAPTSPYRSQGGYQQQQQQQQPNYSNAQQPAPSSFGSGGGFMRGMLGGLAGGMIGSLLFRNMGYAGGAGGFGGGFGVLELVLLLGLGYMFFRFITRSFATAGAQREMSHRERLESVEPGPFANSEATLASTLRNYDPSFELETFRDARMDDFVRLQAAWNLRDLSSVSDLIGTELRQQLDGDVAQLKNSGRINRIENIAVRSAELVEAWQEYGQEFATLRFRANLLDYTVDEGSSQVVAGDKSQPVKFEEDWTFVRAINQPGTSKTWKLTAIS